MKCGWCEQDHVPCEALLAAYREMNIKHTRLTVSLGDLRRELGELERAVAHTLSALERAK